MALGVILVSGLKTTSRWVEMFVVEAFEVTVPPFISRVASASSKTVWDGTYSSQKELIALKGLTAGHPYDLRAGVVAPVSSRITWTQADQNVVAGEDFIKGGPGNTPGPPPECIDPRTYGAKGDGITDDTGAIQSALNQAGLNYTSGHGLTKVCIPSDLHCLVIASKPDGGSGTKFGACEVALFIPSGVTLNLEGDIILGGASGGLTPCLIENTNAFTTGDINIKIEGNGNLITNPSANLGVPSLVSQSADFAEFLGNPIFPLTGGGTLTEFPIQYSIPYSTLTAPSALLMVADGAGLVWLLTWSTDWMFVTITPTSGGSTWPQQVITGDLGGGGPVFLVYVPGDNSLVVGLNNGHVLKYKASVTGFTKLADVVVTSGINADTPVDFKNAPGTDGNILIYDSNAANGTFIKFNPVTMVTVQTYTGVGLVNTGLGIHLSGTTAIGGYQYHASSQTALIYGFSGFSGMAGLFRYDLDAATLIRITGFPVENAVIGNNILIDKDDSYVYVSYWNPTYAAQSMAKIRLSDNVVVAHVDIGDGVTQDGCSGATPLGGGGAGPVVQDNTYIYVGIGNTPNMGYFKSYRKSDLGLVSSSYNPYNGILAIPDGSEVDCSGSPFTTKFGRAGNMVVTRGGFGGPLAYRFNQCDRSRLRDITIRGGSGYWGNSSNAEVLETYSIPNGTGAYAYIFDKCNKAVARDNFVLGTKGTEMTGLAEYACQRSQFEGNIFEAIDMLTILHSNRGFEDDTPATVPYYADLDFSDNVVSGGAGVKLLGAGDRGVNFKGNIIEGAITAALDISGISDSVISDNVIQNNTGGGLTKGGTLINVSILNNTVKYNTGFDINTGVNSPAYPDGTSTVVMWNPSFDTQVYTSFATRTPTPSGSPGYVYPLSGPPNMVYYIRGGSSPLTQGTGTTINIASFTMDFPDKALTYAGTTGVVSTADVLNYVYADDPYHDGTTTVTYGATTSIADLCSSQGRLLVGFFTPLTAGGGTGGVGGSPPTGVLNSLAETSDPYDIAVTLVGKPDDNALLLELPMVRTVNFPAGLTGSRAVAGTGSTGTAVFAIKKNGSTVGSVTFTASTTGVYAMASATTYSAGDVFSIYCPTPQDATLQDIGFIITGTRAG